MFDEVLPTGSPLKFFLEPIAVALNYLETQASVDAFPAYDDVHLLVRRDTCCFGEAQHSIADTGLPYVDALRALESDVRYGLYWLGSGSYRLEIDEAGPSHMISWNAIVNDILTELNGDRPYVGAASTTTAFVRGLSDHMWYYGENGWENTGLPIVGTPAVLERAVHRYDVFFRSPNSQLVHAYSDGAGWTAVPIDSIIISDPSVASWDAGRLDVVALGKSYRPYHWWWNGTAMQGELVSGSDAAMGVGRTSLVATGVDGLQLLMRGRFSRGLVALSTNGSGPWILELNGGIMRGFPAGVATTGGPVHAYVRGNSGQLWQASRLYGGSWEWTSFSAAAGTGGEPTGGSPSAFIQEDGSTLVHARMDSGRLGSFRWSSGWVFTTQDGVVTGSPTSVPDGAHIRDVSGSLWLHDGAVWWPRSGLFH